MSQTKAQFIKSLIATLHNEADELMNLNPTQDYDANDTTSDAMEPLANDLGKSNLNKVLFARKAY